MFTMPKKNILNWEKVVDKGFGDRRNMCAWSMAKYKGYLYVGTLNFRKGCQVYRSKTGEKDSWKQVNLNGFGDTKNLGARTMYIFNDLLWVATLASNTGSQVWVTNGEIDKGSSGMLKWKKANQNGFGEGPKIRGTRPIVVYKNKLHVGTQCVNQVPRIYRYDGPTEFEKINPDSWTWVTKDWEINFKSIPEYSLIGKLECFKAPDEKEYLYAGLYSEIAWMLRRIQVEFSFSLLLKIIRFFTKLRCRILRYDGEKWEQVSKPGFGGPNMMVMSSTVSNDAVYFGTSNIFGAELWKSNGDDKWERIIRRGFGNSMNIAVWSIHTHEDRLIIGIQNLFQGCQIWSSTKRNPESNKDFVKISKTGMDGKFRLNIFKVKQDGIKTFGSFDGYLYAGTSSYVNILQGTVLGPGCEVWRVKR